MKAALTDHAAERAKQRLGLKPGPLRKAADKALAEGLQPADTSGRLKRYLDKQACKGCQPRVWAEHVYIFSRRGVLITVLELPHDLRRPAANCLRKRAKGGAE